MDISIIIPVYNALPLFRLCLQSVYEHGSLLQFEVIVVDNGSTADMQAFVQERQGVCSDLRCLHHDAPLGFAKAVNTGAAAATGDVLIVLNSDTIVTAGWMEDLHAALMDDPSLGAVGPSTNHAGEPAQMDFGLVGVSAAKALSLAGKRTRRPELVYLPQRITFFCVALRRSTWMSFNGLDESYAVGNFEDDDLCLRLRVAGFRLAVARHVFVYHHNNASFAANRIDHGVWMSRNARTFAERARAFAEADPEELKQRLCWPRRSLRDLSVVILWVQGGPLEHTLRSLANQTVVDFEIVRPNSGQQPTRSWIAYVDQGDILYPFHLEALLDAMDRNSREAIFADTWVRGETSGMAHPDTAKHTRQAPLLPAGWMHHASLDRDTLYNETVPWHWPRVTWEMRHARKTIALPQVPQRLQPVEVARSVYRRVLPLSTRLAIDRALRAVLRRPKAAAPEVRQMQALTEQMEALLAAGADRDKFAGPSALPAVFLFNAISWDFVTQRQQHFARGLAELGHAVFWVEPLLAPARNWWKGRPLQQLAPGVHLLRLPGPARDVYHLQWSEAAAECMEVAIAQTAAAYGAQRAVVVINYPRWQPLMPRLRERFGWKVAADLLDDQDAMAEMYQTALFHYEDWLVQKSDLVITSSVVLQARLRGVREAVLLHNATDYDLFSSALPSGSLSHLPGPIVGFFGALANWLDMDLVRAAAEHFPDWTFVYIGPSSFSHAPAEVKWLRTIDAPNIMVLPQMEPHTLATHLAEFDVCTIPFQDVPVTRAMNPVKLYEYLAAGKPVVSRDLPEVRHLLQHGANGLVELYTSHREFFAALERAVREDNAELRARRRAFARENDWSDRVRVLSALLAGLIDE